MTRSILAISTVLSMTVVTGAAPPEQRAKPPSFSDEERSVFFDDLGSVLVGPRPDFSQSSGPPSLANGSAADSESGDVKWSAWISADAVETEVKRQAQRAARLTSSPTTFKSGGYREAGDAFTCLALMFRLAGEHDRQARWRDSAPGLSVLFAEAAANCRTGSDASFRDASDRAQDLQDLIRGSRPDLPAAAESQSWSDIASRAAIMRRIGAAQKGGIGPPLASSEALEQDSDEVAQEAQVLAFLSEVLTRQGFIDAGDESYDALARAMRDAGAGIAGEAERGNYEAAREAYGRLNQACSDCHDAYRG